MRIAITILLLLSTLYSSGQDDVVKLTNPSFEDDPHQGTDGTNIKGWYDCSRKNFYKESPPDIHPAPDTSYWGNFKETYDGETYIGMVTRDNDSWESVSQKLSSYVLAGQCYDFSVVLARNDKYLSGSHKNKNYYNDNSLFPYTTPIVLRLWGGDSYCDSKELLVESPPIDHNDWKRYMFTFKPKSNFNFITIEAFYEVPVFDLYNGHILVDACSDIVKTNCPDRVDIYALDSEDVDLIVEHSVVSVKRPTKPKTTVPESVTKKIARKEDVVVQNEYVPIADEDKVLTELNSKKILKGQVIVIKNLFFAADTSSIHRTSNPILNEIFNFLYENKDVVIELGGHTNNVPSHQYCDRLSKERANSVGSYLKGRGIPPERIMIRGYGKRKPIASNKTMIGRNRNQRVEIKIVDI